MTKVGTASADRPRATITAATTPLAVVGTSVGQSHQGRIRPADPDDDPKAVTFQDDSRDQDGWVNRMGNTPLTSAQPFHSGCV